MAEWFSTSCAVDQNLSGEFIIYARGDTSKDKALKLTREGKLTAKSIEDASGGSVVPPRAIVMWSGPGSEIPTGWALCDGTNGTPNLQGRFILGAGSGDEPGKTGGEARVTLTEAEMPKHRHYGTTDDGGGHSHSWAGYRKVSGVGGTEVQSREWISGDPPARTTAENEGSHSHDFSTGEAGGGSSHENMPPYYVLCFIMKLPKQG